MMHSILDSAIKGHSDVALVSAISDRLDEDMRENGKDTFTMADIRRIKANIFEGREQVSAF